MGLFSGTDFKLGRLNPLKSDPKELTKNILDPGNFFGGGKPRPLMEGLGVALDPADVVVREERKRQMGGAGSYQGSTPIEDLPTTTSTDWRTMQPGAQPSNLQSGGNPWAPLAGRMGMQDYPMQAQPPMMRGNKGWMSADRLSPKIPPANNALLNQRYQANRLRGG